MAQVNGLLESSLYVSDLERAHRFYRDLFGFECMYAEADRMRALNVAGRQVLLLFRKGGSTAPIEGSGGTIPPHDGGGQLHLAFSVDPEELQSWERRLAEMGIPIESRVRFSDSGQSLYFRDPDGHLVELITPGCWPIY